MCLTRQSFAILLLLIFSFFSFSTNASESVYTSLEKGCTKIKRTLDEKRGNYPNNTYLQCPGIGGYKIILEKAGNLTSLRVLTPQGKEVRLPSEVCSDDCLPSVTANQAEWILSDKNKSNPQALILRLRAESCVNGNFQGTSYLAVVKLTPNEVCFTDKIPPGPQQNELARKAAVEASVNSCHYSSCQDKTFKWCHNEGEPCGH